MAVLVALPLAVHDVTVAVVVALISYAGVSVSHRKYFELSHVSLWLGMAATGLAYTASAALAMLYYGHIVSSISLLLAGIAKPVAYSVAKRIQPNQDFLALAELVFGAIVALGLISAYQVFK